jgi:pimeloyl-ACP methyl ester carboxylesterase
MLVKMRSSAYCILTYLLLMGAPAAAQAQAEVTLGAATFNVFFRSRPIGFEQVELSSGPNGWIIRSRGNLSRPVLLQNQLFEVEYDEQWHPRALSITAIRHNTLFSFQTTFTTDGATSELEEAGQRRSIDHTLPPDSVVLPAYFFAGYEALSQRLAIADPGDQFPVFMAPEGNGVVRLDQVILQQIETGSEVIEARVHRITILNAEAPITAEVWTDANRRLLRVSIPEAELTVAREDIASVSSRVRRTSHAGDKKTRIEAEGFALSATITTPVDHPRPETGWPAVLLVPSPAAADRDGAVATVPVLGQIAGALADAGFLVARYDSRGIGQSGGRAESADLEVYANDARTVVRYLDKRDDVDRDQITVLGYDAAGWIAMIAAGKERRADRLVLVAVPSTSGAELLLEQQRVVLDRIGVSETERTEKIRLQQQIHDAVLGNESWDGVQEDMRRQADTAWFRSFLSFDAVDAMRKTRQPILILHGSLDNEVGLHHAKRLEDLTQARRRDTSTERVTLEGLNHLLLDVNANGAVDYAGLKAESVSPLFNDTLISWLARVP